MNRIFGSIDGFPEGSFFNSRKDLNISGVHRPTQAGISGSQADGADSIVISGGYEDDEDFGNEIIYTGHGGRDINTEEIISDQELSRQNLALALNKDNGYPVRVVRGHTLRSPYAPQSGYRYDGLYSVEDYWQELKRGHIILRFRLRKIPNNVSTPPIHPQQLIGLNSRQKPERKLFQTYRVIRDTQKSLEVKRLYDYHCQVCNIRLEGPSGAYVEAAHIKPLGNPHNGPDDQDNIICLCPNHHVLFDNCAFTIADDLSLVGLPGKLLCHNNHSLNKEYLEYRRNHYMIKRENL